VFFGIIAFAAFSFAEDVESGDTIVTVANISISGNKITKDRIIFRELEFETGSETDLQTLDSLIVKSRQNLINRSIFNFVTITKTIDNNQVDIVIAVIERWYIWPIPIIQFADRNINAWWNKRDFSRMNYGVDLRVDNFRGLMEKLNIILQIGYDIKVATRWTIPYLTKNQVVGMDIEGGVQFNHTIAYQTVDNKEQFYNSTSGFAQQNIFGALGLTFRPKYNYLHSVQFGYNQLEFQDTINKLNPDFGSLETKFNYFTFRYSFKLDFRDYKPYPLKGYYFDASVSKLGFGLFNNDVNNISLSANFDQYIRLYSRWYFAYSLGFQVSNDNQQLPYFIKSGIGYFPNDIRGYELYVVDGQQLGLFKSNFKFEIMPQTTFNINWIKSTKFSEVFFAMYANLFFDMGYVNDIYTQKLNPLTNQLIWGTGIGLDMVTYYDLVLRLELSINKQKEQGFFISFVAPI